MFNFIYFEIRNWWLGEAIDIVDEFQRMESQHTRVHHEDIYEIIRVH